MILRQLLLGAFVFAALLAQAHAVEPFTIGTVTTILGMVWSILSFVIQAIKYFLHWALFVLILVGILINFIVPIAKNFNLVAILEKWVGDTVNCDPVGPGADRTSILGNLGTNFRGAIGVDDSRLKDSALPNQGVVQ